MAADRSGRSFGRHFQRRAAVSRGSLSAAVAGGGRRHGRHGRRHGRRRYRRFRPRTPRVVGKFRYRVEKTGDGQMI